MCRARDLEERLHDVDHFEVAIQYGQGSPLIEREAGMTDVKSDHIPHTKIVPGTNLKIRVLIHHFRDDPMFGRWLRSAGAGAEVKCGHGEA